MSSQEKVSIWMNRNFLMLWFSQASNIIAQILLQICLVTYIYHLSSSVIGAASIPAVSGIAMFVGSFLASHFIQRFNIQKILQWIGFMRAGLLAILIVGLWYFADFVYEMIGMMLLVQFMLSLLSSWYQPARFALIPLIVSNKAYTQANGALVLIQQTLYTIGWSLGATAVLYLPTSVLLISSLGLFCISGVAMLFVKLEKIESPNKTRSRSKPAWKLVWQNPLIRSITLMDITEGLANAIWSSAILLGFTKMVLQRSEDWWGYINAGYFVGAIIGSFIVMWLGQGIENKLALLIVISSISMAFLTGIFSLGVNPVLCVVVCVLMGPMNQIRDIGQVTLLQSIIEPTQRANIWAAREMILSPWNSVTILIIGFLADLIGIQRVYFLAAVIYLITALLVWIQPSWRSQFISSK